MTLFEFASNLSSLAFHIFSIAQIILIRCVAFRAKLFSTFDIFQVYSCVTKNVCLLCWLEQSYSRNEFGVLHFSIQNIFNAEIVH